MYVRQTSVSHQDEDMAVIRRAAMNLEEAITAGDLVKVKSLLDNVVDLADVKAIEKEFDDRDPVVCAVDYDKEQIAVYLVEKQFSTTNYYCYPGEECEPHCYVTHEGRPCPNQYTVMDMLKNRKMDFLKKTITDIHSGKRKAGDSLSENRRISVDSTESLEHQFFMNEISEHNDDKYTKIAERLENLIQAGELIPIKRLLNHIVQINEVEMIMQEYPSRDPLVAAVEAGHEKIACYLIEKRFPYNVPYFYDGQECDEWCSRLHTNRPCPNQYTALDIAKSNKLRSVQGLIESLMAGKRQAGDALKLERRVSLDQLPVFERDVVMATDEYRIAMQLADLIDEGNLEGVKKLLDPIKDITRVSKIEYVFDDRDPVVYAVEKDQSLIAHYLIKKMFTFTKPYRLPGGECDTWCYSQHEGKPCCGIYTAMSLARSRGLLDLHTHMTRVRQMGRLPSVTE